MYLNNFIVAAILAATTASAKAVEVLPDPAYPLDPSVPTIAELNARINNVKNPTSLGRRDDWGSDNNFRFYVVLPLTSPCPVQNPTCTRNDQYVIKLDPCFHGACDSREGVDSMRNKDACDKPFTACRFNVDLGSQRTLIMKRTGDPYSCENLASTALYSRPHLGTYASLHENGGGHIGWCWFAKDHRFIENCKGFRSNVDSVIRCSWM